VYGAVHDTPPTWTSVPCIDILNNNFLHTHTHTHTHTHSYTNLHSYSYIYIHDFRLAFAEKCQLVQRNKGKTEAIEPFFIFLNWQTGMGCGVVEVRTVISEAAGMLLDILV
jgi:hypothetical protein